MTQYITLEDLVQIDEGIALYEGAKTMQQLDEEAMITEQAFEQQAEMAWLKHAEYDPDPDFY